jgi:hypothetical protein
MILASASQDEKAVAAEQSGGQIVVKREAEFARHSQDPLPESITKVDSPRRVEVVEHLIPRILQGLQSCFFAEKVKMIV